MNLLQFASGFGLGLLCLAQTGCQTQISRLGAGYEIVTHPTYFSRYSFADEPASPRDSFEFLDPSGKSSIIWPDVYANYCVVQGEYAVFVGNLSYSEPDSKTTRPRLFAVQAPELPVDITDEVIWRWSKSTGNDFVQAENRFNSVRVTAKNVRLAIHLQFWSGGILGEGGNSAESGDVELDWKQVAAILRTEKRIGVVEKDLQWHTQYIGIKITS